MPKTFIGVAVCREFESEAPASEENVRPCRMQQRTVQFSGVPWKWWRNSAGKLFHSCGPATEKLLSPTRVLVGGTIVDVGWSQSASW